MPESRFADTDPADLHVPQLGDRKKKPAKHPAFLSRLSELLKSYVTRDVFNDAVKQARSHAGGVARAEARQHAEGDAPTGVAVVLPVPADVAADLTIANGLPAGDLHVTLCMIGDTDTLGGVQLAEALLAVRDAGLIAGPLTATIGGIGRFTATGGQDAVYLSVDSPALNDLWDVVCDELEEAGIECEDDHGFTPHITLAYIDPGAPMPLDTIAPRQVTFSALALWAGTQRTAVPLVGMGDDGDGDDDADEDAETVPGMALPEVLQHALGADAAGHPTMAELADIAARGHTHRLFNAVTLAEAPEWIPYLPKPGTYSHPRYGDIAITRERNARFVTNFANKIYQDRLPVDAEHETKLSGAVGWITAMRQNADGSADAKVDWTDRGKAFFADNRFRYFSPEWYDAWQRPETGETFKDVAIGGAICTRPFFKPPALRALFASEAGLITTTTDEGDTMADQNTQSFAELQTKLAALEAENTTLKAAGEQNAQALKAAGERLAAIETERQAERFTALIQNGGARWFGEAKPHLDILRNLAKTFGEGSAEFAAYVDQQKAVAAMLRQSAVFNELGSDGGGRVEDASAKLDRMARELAKAERIDYAAAMARVAAENPELYEQHSNAAYVKQKGSE